MKKYSDVPVPENACHYRIATHTLRKGGDEIKSRSYCRKLVEPGSEYCPRHAFLMRQKEIARLAKEAAEKQPELHV